MVAACNDQRGDTPMKMLTGIAATFALAAAASAAAHGPDFFAPRLAPSAVYTETNASDNNEILVFTRHRDGELRLASKASTRGAGTDSGLGSQGALALRRDGRRLYAVNAGSNDISVFATRPGGLVFIERVPSGGTSPISLTVREDVLYVLNAGDAALGIAANITGFDIGEDRRLHPIPDSTRALSTANPAPAQIEFDPWGDVLVVTEKATNQIDLYAVEDGLATGPFVAPSNGATPFGFAFDRRGRLIVSEAFGGAAAASAVSSYDVDDASSPLELISGSVPTLQTAACWVVVTKDGRFAYTTNTGSGNVSGYRISHAGRLTLLKPTGVSGSTGAGSTPTDMALSADSRALFTLNPGVGTLASFRIRVNGNLVPAGTALGIPGSASGLAAH
jgi:6-phosphogluconolactonase